MSNAEMIEARAEFALTPDECSLLARRLLLRRLTFLSWILLFGVAIAVSVMFDVIGIPLASFGLLVFGIVGLASFLIEARSKIEQLAPTMLGERRSYVFRPTVIEVESKSFSGSVAWSKYKTCRVWGDGYCFRGKGISVYIPSRGFVSERDRDVLARFVSDHYRRH
jgi:hypothetical protein